MKMLATEYVDRKFHGRAFLLLPKEYDRETGELLEQRKVRIMDTWVTGGGIRCIRLEGSLKATEVTEDMEIELV